MGSSQISLTRYNDKPATRVVVNQGAAGTTLLKAAELGKKHTLVGAILTLSADGTLKFQSAATDLSGPLDIAAKGGFVHDSIHPFFETAKSEDLNLVTTGGAARGVALVITEDA